MPSSGRPISIERLVAGAANAELIRVRNELERRKRLRWQQVNKRRVKQATTDGHRARELFSELYAIMKRNIGPGNTGTDRGELTRDLRELKRAILAWCNDNARSAKVVMLDTRNKKGRPVRASLHGFNRAIERYTREQNPSINKAAERIAKLVLDQFWRLDRLTEDEFAALFPNMERSFPRWRVEALFAESLRVAYQQRRRRSV